MNLTNKVAIITGAASGIGLATARLFAAAGAQVVLADLNEHQAQAASDQMKSKYGNTTRAAACDVSNPADVKRTYEGALAAYGYVDVIVNNAGLMIFKKLEDHSAADWQKILQVDLLGAFFFIQQAFVHMSRGGSIINVSSIHAVETTPMVTSYAAAKAALLSLTRSAALEGKTRKIRVNAVLPGAVDTPMLWENPNLKSGIEVLDKADVGKPEDLAAVIGFLASDEAAFVQGAAIRVDGGRLARL
jgi:NAD(P)-dependent dehydrogenase (short-subunit alcohol dehydrogenase family)